MTGEMDRRGRGALTGTIALALLVGLGAAPARADETSWGEFLGAPLYLRAATGFEYDRGDFGQQIDSEIYNVPFSVRAEWNAFVLGVSTSWVQFQSPSPNPPVGSNLRRASTLIDSGIGDTTVRVGYVVDAGVDSWLPVAELGVRVKIPTADEDEFLGTGETDVTLQIDLAQRFGPLTAFAGAGYRFVGGPLRSDAGGVVVEVDLDDVWLASLGGSLSLTSNFDLGLVYDYRQASFDGVDDVHELQAFGFLRLDPRLSVGPYALTGFTQSSPEFGVGFQVIVRGVFGGQ